MPDVTTRHLADWIRTGRAFGGLDPGGADSINIPPFAAWIGWRIRDIVERLNKQHWQALPGAAENRSGYIAVLLARAVAEKAIDLALSAEHGGKAGGAAQLLNTFIDDYCGNGRRPGKGPWPRGIDVAFGPRELLLIAGQLQAGAALGGGEALAAAAQKVAAAATVG